MHSKLKAQSKKGVETKIYICNNIFMIIIEHLGNRTRLFIHARLKWSIFKVPKSFRVLAVIIINLLTFASNYNHVFQGL